MKTKGLALLLATATPLLAEISGDYLEVRTCDVYTGPCFGNAEMSLAGKEAVMLTVEYPPGGSSSKHRHNAHTFVYVLEGSIVMQVEGGKAVTLGPGQTFYESPDDIHTVSKNTSDSQPAKFLVFFVKDKGVPASTPVK